MIYRRILKPIVWSALFVFVAAYDFSVSAMASELSSAPIPANIPDSVQLLKSALPKKTIDGFKSMSEGESIERYDSSLGSWIRNNWIRTHDQEPLARYFLSAGVHNPEYISTILLSSLWRDLHNQPINLDELLRKSRTAELYDGAEISEKRKVTDVIWNTPLNSCAGKTFKLADFKGKKLILVLIWSDGSSREAVAALNAMNKQSVEGSLAIVAIVSVPGSLSEADKRTIVGEFKSTFPVVLKAPSSFEAELTKALIAPGSLELPSTLVIQPDGIMTVRFNGWDRETANRIQQLVASRHKAFSMESYSS